ncbi:transcription elongation factor GreA [endosymbiont of Sipalinus gigas]|uniref:GreA/GreB family elongation factor n=1 Tax=endosymbiont of Sipalinus gigas TaxID=1972134 RepID=UPI000DC6E268|nr:transcription elongation factor GreA [endosymbiont of Sipalinus gigas]BBA85371.1 transcription elongation factor GreA [endosymbiont of Sipalinus gigas]
MDSILISKEGIRKLKKKLDYIKNIKIPEIINSIREARSYGDIKENYEYKSAKEQQKIYENKIIDIEEKLSKLKIINLKNRNLNLITIYSKVKILNIDNNKINIYHIVSEFESNIDNNKISINSPVAKSILNKKINDIVEIKAPIGILRYKILSIN